jgi:hypothetical protein
LVPGICSKAGGPRRDVLPVANVFEVEKIAVWVDAKNYTVVLAYKKPEIIEVVSDLVSGIWSKAVAPEGSLFPLPPYL